MGINIEVDHEQFLAVHGKSDFVNKFTHEAQVVLLGYVEQMQSKDADVDWVALFTDATEYDNLEVISSHKDSIQEHAGKIVAMAKYLEISDKLRDKLKNEQGCSNGYLLAQNFGELLKCEGFVNAATLIIAENKDFIKLSNGNWLKIVDS